MSVWGTPPPKMPVIGSLWYVGMYLTICNKFYLVWARANLAYFLEPSYLVCLTTPTNQNVCHMRIMHFWTVIIKSSVISSGMFLAWASPFLGPISVAPLTTPPTNAAPDAQFLLREVTRNAKISKVIGMLSSQADPQGIPVLS